MSNNRKLLVASVLKFLKAEIDSKKITPDQEESLNVASQVSGSIFWFFWQELLNLKF